MTMATHITFLCFVSVLILTTLAHPILHVDNLNGLSSLTPEYESIFLPHYVSKHGNHTKHNIHVMDRFGKYLKLSYEAIHPPNTDILKIDDPIHKINIESVSCDDNDNTITLHFKTNVIALQYYHQIHSSLSTPNQSYYITASHEWGCINPSNQRYESIIRQVTSIKLDIHKQLILTITHADITDIFQDLHLNVVTNIGQHAQKFVSTKQHQRKALSIWGTLKSLWHKITDNIGALREDIMKEITAIRKTASTIIKYSKGLPVDYKNSSHYSWSWNADDESYSNSFYIGDGVSCDHCFAKFDLEYKYELHIVNRQVQYLLLMGEGQIDMKVGINGLMTIHKEWSMNTPRLPVPDLSIGVAGCVLGVYVNGQFAVGVAIGIDDFSYTVDATGYIKKGVVYNNYDPSMTSGDYISEEDVTYTHHGPRMQFKSANIRLYTRASINLGLSFVGDIAFGLQPDFTLRFEKQNASSDCALYCTPSVGLAVFIRADMELTSWYKTWPMYVTQTDISDWGGCLSHVDVTKLQTKIGVPYNGYDHRRLMEAHVLNISDAAVTYIDFSLSKSNQYHTSDRYSQVEGWGREGTYWWSNMSTLDTICDEYDMTHNHVILRPNDGSLMISVNGNGTLTALYQTRMEISPHNRWNWSNVTMYTNASCVARHLLVHNEDASRTNHISTYDVQLLDWYCDIDLEYLGIDKGSDDAWICMLSLPKQLYAMQLGFEFRDIMLFDRTWCKVFQLTKKREYVMDNDAIDWKRFESPSKLWYGVVDCYNESGATEMYFIEYNKTNHTHTVAAVLSIEYTNWTSWTLYAEGRVDFKSMRMTLHVLYLYERRVSFSKDEFVLIGAFKVLQDGTITFYGSIANSGCIGFIFQGFLNLTQFDDDDDGTVYSNSDASVPSVEHRDDEKTHSSTLATVVLVMAIVFMVFVFIWMIHQCMIHKKVDIPSVNVKYQLMNNDNL
eukprot:359631_1